MPYPYVWIVIGFVQFAFILLVIAFWMISRSQRACGIGNELSGEVVPCDEPTIRRAERACRSPFWWRRLHGARILGFCATAAHRTVIQKLLTDRHPAVQTAGTQCLKRYADEELIAQVLDSLYLRARLVWTHQLGVLELYHDLAVPLLRKRLQSFHVGQRHEVRANQLKTYIRVAEQLQDHDCLERVADFSTHSDPEVRVTVARVLGRSGLLGRGETAVIKLLVLLRDPAWAVRAQAARSLGLLQDERAIPALLRALSDSSWWVRFRSATGLAMLGERGREALSSAGEMPDRFARDMAVFVNGLSSDSIAHMAGDS